MTIIRSPVGVLWNQRFFSFFCKLKIVWYNSRVFYTVNKTKTVATLVHEPWSNTPSRGNEEVELSGGNSPSPCSPKRGWKTASDATDARRLQASEASEAAEESTYMCIYICIPAAEESSCIKVEKQVAQPSASWLSGGSSQRQIISQAAPSFGQPLGQPA